MTRLRQRALRTLLVVVLAGHVAHCPSVNSGPDTGCVRSGKPGGINDGAATEELGRQFPEIPTDARGLLLRIDETASGVVPTAQYIEKFQPNPADPLAVLPRLTSIGECECIRSDGQACSATTTAAPPAQGNPVECAPIGILGIDPHPPASGIADCVLDRDCNEDADGGRVTPPDGLEERCVPPSCSRPLVMTYDSGRQRYAVAGDRIMSQQPLEGHELTIELYPVTGGSATAGTCPTGLASARLRVVTKTSITTPASGASVPRDRDLPVGWVKGDNVGFVLVVLRGRGGGEERILLCRGLDSRESVNVVASQLSRLDPGTVTLELMRLNGTSIAAPPVQGTLLSVSTRSIPLTLQ